MFFWVQVFWPEGSLKWFKSWQEFMKLWCLEEVVHYEIGGCGSNHWINSEVLTLEGNVSEGNAKWQCIMYVLLRANVLPKGLWNGSRIGKKSCNPVYLEGLGFGR